MYNTCPSDVRQCKTRSFLRTERYKYYTSRVRWGGDKDREGFGPSESSFRPLGVHERNRAPVVAVFESDIAPLAAHVQGDRPRGLVRVHARRSTGEESEDVRKELRRELASVLRLGL